MQAGVGGRWGAFAVFIIPLLMNLHTAARAFYGVRRRWRSWRNHREARRGMKAWAKEQSIDEKNVVVVPPIGIEPHELAELERDPDAFMRKKILADPDSYPAGLVEAMREQDGGTFEKLD